MLEAKDTTFLLQVKDIHLDTFQKNTFFFKSCDNSQPAIFIINYYA
jgi:hypothetical protein